MSGHLPRLDRRRFLGAAGATAGMAATGRFGPGDVFSLRTRIKLALRHATLPSDRCSEPTSRTSIIATRTSSAPRTRRRTTHCHDADPVRGGGAHFDVLFADEGLTQRWDDNGWIRKIDDLPGFADAHRGRLPADLLPALKVGDGSTVALPYAIAGSRSSSTTRRTSTKSAPRRRRPGKSRRDLLEAENRRRGLYAVFSLLDADFGMIGTSSCRRC